MELNWLVIPELFEERDNILIDRKESVTVKVGSFLAPTLELVKCTIDLHSNI